MSNLTKIANFEDEDDDLELLRLAALKSLNIKKDIISPPSSSHGVVNIGKAIQVIEHVGPVSLVRNTNSVNNFNTTRRIEKLEVSEPYVPQKIVRNGQWVNENISDYVPYVPTRVAGALGPIASNIGTNVQLSPRSLAFVSQNTSILLRRKGEASPGNYNRSPIPSCRTPRWSSSPPPVPNSPIYYNDQRRSISFSPPNKRRRSPSFRRSPVKRRSISRSPIPIKCFTSRSPIYKGKASKSPIRNLTRHNIGANKITTVKSPRPLREHQKSPTMIKNRRNSPSRHNQSQGRGRRSMSPMYNRNPSLDAKITAKWHQSHSHNQTYSSSPNNYQKGKKRSRSPIVSGNAPFNRGMSPNKSRSGSPVQRKQIRRSKDVSYNGNQINNRRRNSPTSSYSRKLNKNNRRSGNKYRSPVRRRTRSKSPKDRKDKPSKKNDKISDKDKDVGNKLPVKSDKVGDETKISKNSENNENDTQKISNLDEIDKISDNESSLSDDDENEDEKTTNNDNDEIDLFASEESESENEGRFKSSTKKCERNSKSSTLSFSKLGNSSTVTLVGSLKDISSGNGSNTEKNRSNDRHSRNNRDYRRGDTYKKLDNRSNSSRKLDDWKDNKNKDATNDKDKSNKRDDNNGNNMRMFKSTFQAVVDTDIKDRKYSPKYKEETSRDSKDLNYSSKENSDKRIVINKKSSNEDDKDTANAAKPTNTGIVASALNTAGKKSIHLRLGPSSKATTQSGTIGSSAQNSTSSGSSNTGDVNSVKATLASAAVPIISCTGNSNVTSSTSSWKTKKTPWRKSEKENDKW